MNSLRVQRGYKRLLEYAEGQIKGRTENFILKPLASMDATLEQEFNKGEVSGITLFTRFCDIMIDELSREISEILKEKGETDADSNEQVAGS